MWKRRFASAGLVAMVAVISSGQIRRPLTLPGPPPESVPGADAPEVNLYVHSTETDGKGRFPIVVEVSNFTVAPIKVEARMFADVRSDFPGDAQYASQMPRPEHVLIAVLHVNFQFVKDRPVPQIGGSRDFFITQAGAQEPVITLTRAKRSLNRVNLPAGLFAPGDNVMELVLEEDGKQVATSGVIHVTRGKVEP